MPCATVADLKILIENAKDTDVLYFSIRSEDDPETVRYASEISDVATLTAVGKRSFQTADGDRDIIKINLCIDLDPKD
jgi:hypothetical protein